MLPDRFKLITILYLIYYNIYIIYLFILLYTINFLYVREYEFTKYKYVQITNVFCDET